MQQPATVFASSSSRPAFERTHEDDDTPLARMASFSSVVTIDTTFDTTGSTETFVTIPDVPPLPPSEPTKVVFVFESGGVKIIMAILWLAYIQMRVNALLIAKGLSPQPLRKLVDHVAGTSAGAIVAVMFLRVDTHRMPALWETFAHSIFQLSLVEQFWRLRRGLGGFLRKCSSKKLATGLRNSLIGAGFATNATMASLNTDGMPTVTITTSAAHDITRPILINSRSFQQNAPDLSHVTILDALVASTSAPGYFNYKSLALYPWNPKVTTKCWDGALSAPNPSSALKLDPTDTGLAVNFTVEPADGRKVELKANTRLASIVDWMWALSQLAVNPRHAHERTAELFAALQCRDRYFRLGAPAAFENIDISDYTRVGEMIKMGKQMLATVACQVQVDAIAERIVELKAPMLKAEQAADAARRMARA